MADKKISALTAITSATDVDATNDVLPIVDNTGPETKKIAVANLPLVANFPSDSTPINKIRQMTASDYGLITPDSDTLYIIVG